MITELLEHARILRLQPGDVVVISLPSGSISPQADEFKRTCFPNNEVIFLADGASLQVVHPDPSTDGGSHGR